jgi:hypothetical protein
MYNLIDAMVGVILFICAITFIYQVVVIIKDWNKHDESEYRQDKWGE